MNELEQFRASARQWLEGNCPEPMRQPLTSDADHVWGGRRWEFACDAQRLWFERMVAKGWTAPQWPVEYGGAGLTPAQHDVLAAEMKRINARSPVSNFGFWMLGPALLKFGSQEQKLEHLPAIARGEIRWCQGYSEPNAGSDLASLKTTAEPDGDHFVVNGRKIWTSYADRADAMFCLVRTDNSVRKQAGISFLLMDMASEGISTRPIQLISGESPFCETFFDEQQMLADLAERLFTDKAHIATLREIRDGNRGESYDAPLWQAMGEAGLTGIVVPETHGGMEFGLVGAGLVAREIGRRPAMTPFLSTSVLGALALGQAGMPEQQSRWLPQLVTGRLIIALAGDEGSKHRPERVATRAVAGDKGVKITGDKTLVIDAPNAELLLVSATADGVAQLFAVDARDAGVSIQPVPMLDTRSVADVRLDNAIGEPLAESDSALAKTLDAGRAILAAELVGLSRSVFERTLGYLRERKQFGVPIGSFQALQHRAAHLSVEIAISEAMAFQALAAYDQDIDDASGQILAAKARAADTARLACAEAVQMHGGMGMTDEFDIGFFMKRARAASETLGDSNYCADQFARGQGY